MLPFPPANTTPSARGLAVALIFASAAQQLHAWYEHGSWPSIGQQVREMADWPQRRQTALPEQRRLQLAELAATLARHLAATLTREAGLYAAHDMMEALDPRHDSEFSRQLMQECERLLAAADAGEATA